MRRAWRIRPKPALEFRTVPPPSQRFGVLLGVSLFPWWTLSSSKENLHKLNQLALCGIRLVMTTGKEWSLAERFVSGSAQVSPCATRPTVDLRSVPRFLATSSSCRQLHTADQEKANTRPHLTTWEVPVNGLGLVRGPPCACRSSAQWSEAAVVVNGGSAKSQIQPYGH